MTYVSVLVPGSVALRLLVSRLDLGMLLKSATAEAEAVAQQQSQFISQFTKPASDNTRQNSSGVSWLAMSMA